MQRIWLQLDYEGGSGPLRTNWEHKLLVVNLWAELGISPKHAASRKAKILRKPLKNKKTTDNLSCRWSFLTCRKGQISLKKVIYSRVRQLTSISSEIYPHLE